MGHPFSRSYGVILPSSFTRVLPSACGYSPRPPVSVYGTGALATGTEDFLGSVVSARLRPEGLPIAFQDYRPHGFAYQSSLRAWTRTSNRGRCLTFCVSSLLIPPPP